MLYIDSIWEYIINFLELALFIIFIHKKLRIRANYKHQAVLMFQTVDKALLLQGFVYSLRIPQCGIPSVSQGIFY